MAIPWQTIEQITTEEGKLELRKRGKRDYLITINGRVLMNSMSHRSEVALGQLVCRPFADAPNTRVLIGGLGMGYTLRAVLDSLHATASVVVAELNPVVLKWCQGPLAHLTGFAVGDPRVEVKIDDVACQIRRHAEINPHKKLHAIILDLYTGPYAHSHDRDDPLFGGTAIRRARKALRPGGIFAVWGENYDSGFSKRLSEEGFSVTTKRSGKGSVRHVIYQGRLGTGKHNPKVAFKH